MEEAWSSVLRLHYTPEYRTLVHFPDNPLNDLDSNTDNSDTTYKSLTFRLSYLAKERRKIYNRHARSFECSQDRKS
nr:inovirus-type Gp2 protein [Cronobacter sakazakii]